VSELLRVPERLYAGYVFDLDSTIYLGSELLPGAARVLRAPRELRRKVVFVSNNPTRDPEEYAVKLSDLGVPAPPSQVINTVVTTTDWLAVNAPEATVFPVSEEPPSAPSAAAASASRRTRARSTSSSPPTTGTSTIESSKSRSTPSARGLG
jgi:ribonucleotide monophosphatase NagD (HAD superfamily)